MNNLRQLLIAKTGKSKEPKKLLDSGEEQKETSALNPKSKKIQKFKREDYKEAKLLDIGRPYVPKKGSRSKKRYAVDVKFTDTRTGKDRTKQVQFGKEGKDEFIDHHDDKKRRRSIVGLSQDDNPLHPNFYKLYLLNYKDTIEESYDELCKDMFKETL